MPMNDTQIDGVRSRVQEIVSVLHRYLDAPDPSANQLAALGQRLHSAGKPEDALAAFERASSLCPDRPEYWHAVTALRLETGRKSAALDACNRALELDPDNADSLFNAAVVLAALNALEPALHAYEKVLHARPDHRGALLNRPGCLQSLARFDDAVTAAEAAVTRFPDDADIWFNLGDAYTSADRHEEAHQSYLNALQRNASLAKAAVAAAVADAALGRLDAASSALDSLRSTAPDALRNFSSPLRTDTFAAYPELEPGRVALIAAYADYRACEWSKRQSYADLFCRVVDGVDCRPLDNPDLPFLGIGLPVSGDYRLRAARQVAARIGRDAPKKKLQRPVARTASKIRIGYVSGDFRMHPTAYLVTRLFEDHDRSRFEVFAYATGPADESEYRQRIKDAADTFVDAAAWGSHVLAQRIARDRIDILVDLQGYTLYAQSAAFALRPAPVQVTYLAYLSTLGAPWVDYAILDRHVLTVDERAFWSERIAYLPDTLYLCDDAQATGSEADRHELRMASGLPVDTFVYCCLNAPWKISPEDFACWTRVLSAVPDSVLWLYADTPKSIANLRSQAKVFGIAEDRLVFADTVPHSQHLERFAAADLFLDTRHCNAHTTAIEALACGLPIITMPGNTVVSRVGASLLHAHGLHELVVGDDDAYVDLAVGLARDADVYSRLRERASDRTQSRLFASREKIRQIERAYETMIKRHRAGLPPADFDVSSES